MGWVFFVLFDLVMAFRGVRAEQRAGLWSWSKFAFALGFAALEWLIIMAPLRFIDVHSRYFVPGVVVAGIVAVLNFVWMIIICRRWKLPDGRTSLQAYYDQKRAVEEAKKT
jgi:hypothetical protein